MIYKKLFVILTNFALKENKSKFRLKLYKDGGIVITKRFNLKKYFNVDKNRTDDMMKRKIEIIYKALCNGKAGIEQICSSVEIGWNYTYKQRKFFRNLKNK